MQLTLRNQGAIANQIRVAHHILHVVYQSCQRNHSVPYIYILSSVQLYESHGKHSPHTVRDSTWQLCVRTALLKTDVGHASGGTAGKKSQVLNAYVYYLQGMYIFRMCKLTYHNP